MVIPQIRRMSEATPLHDVSDKRDLTSRKPNFRCDLLIAHAKFVAMCIDGREVFISNGIAAANLVVVAHAKDHLTKCFNQCRGNTKVRSAESDRHLLAVSLALAVACARFIGSANGALMAIGQTRMHSKH